MCGALRLQPLPQRPLHGSQASVQRPLPPGPSCPCVRGAPSPPTPALCFFRQPLPGLLCLLCVHVSRHRGAPGPRRAREVASGALQVASTLSFPPGDQGPLPSTHVPRKLAVFDTWSAVAVHVAMDNTVVMEDIRRLCGSSLPCAGAAASPADADWHWNGFPAGAEASSRPAPWRPLVLLIPLRLGLTDMNAAYAETLKRCFRMPQSLGVIGGKPNSAHYFIGYVGEELIYLDPHTTQPAVQAPEHCRVPDESFHCQHPPSRMSLAELDPSIAVGFFCKTEGDFNDWCQQVKQLCLPGGGLPMFELVERQPSHLACADALNLSLDASDVERLERFFDSEDEDFEILSL
ncbi:cysteine protease ATG4B isoform X2 [Hippopotamus amphibius kiboko]|uniref:cysteine protease ATG4B isoform X2 n=1 Tax=Hippopotamus amphibius kiboko TaxID=575201 RepID=UPI002593B2D3|nr:cysteine protease ATG4B isoform X2 [Hippopotamus amphibius kiboko]